MANRKSNNGIIIDVGFRDDIESFINSVESALEDVNFDESIGLSKAFDEQVKKVKQQLKDIKEEFRSTMGELNADNITVAMQTLTKDMSALKKIVKEVVTKVPGADGLAKQLDEISQEVQSVAANAANAQQALNSMSTQKLTKEQRQYKTDLKETYKLLQDIVKANEETATPKRQSGRSAYKAIEDVLTDIEGAYQALQDAESKYYEALDTNAPERMLDNAQRNYALAISTFARLAATFDDVASKTNSSQRTATQLLGVDGATIQHLADSYLGELDSFYEEAQGRIAKVAKEYADAGFGELVTQRSKKSVKEAQEDIKGQELVVPLNVSTMPDDLSKQALEIIHQAQAKITEPLTVKVVFVSEYKSKKNQEILEGMKEQIKHIDDAGIKEKFTTLTDNLEKQIKGSLSFEVDVRTEHATQQVKAFKKQIQEELQELSDFIAPITPKVELTDKHAAAFERQLSAATKEVFAEVDNIKIPGMTNTDEILVALGSIFKQIMMIEVRANAIVQLLQKQPESTINKYADALGTFANIVNEITKTKDALKVVIKPIVQNAEKVKEDIGEQLTGIDVPITVSIQSNNIEEQVELLKNKINEEIFALNDQLNALQPNVELSDDSKAKFQQELIEATNQIFADLHVFTDSLDELKTGVSDMFTPVTEDLQKTMGYIWEQVNLIEVRVKHIMDMIEENSHDTVSGEIWKMVNLIEVRVKRIMDLLEGFFKSDIFNVKITPIVVDAEQAKANIIEQLKDIDIPVNIVVSKDSAEKAKTAITDGIVKSIDNVSSVTNTDADRNQTISYLENTAKAIDAINKLLGKLGGKNGDATIQKTVDGLNQIRDALSSPITENSMMDALKELAAQGVNLENLATVLKASKKDLLNAQQILGSANDQNIDDLMTNRAQEIRNRAVEEMLTLGGAGSKYVNVSNLSKTKDGLIEIVGLIQNADGNMQEFTLHTQDGVHMQNVAMSENTAKIAKQMKIYAQVDEYFKRMQNAGKNAIENGGIIDIERDSELWKMLLDFIQEYGIELENVQKIVAKTRQTSGGELLLESFTASDKENSVTFGRAQNVVASSQSLLDPEQLATDFKKAQKTLQEYTELSYKVANNTATDEEIQRLNQINSSYLDLYDRLEKINGALGITSTVAQEARSEFENMQHLTMEQYFQSAIDKGEKAIQKIRDKYAKVAPEGSIDATKYTESDQQIINNIVESNRQLRELIEQINQGQIDYNAGLQQARVLTEQINANITQSSHKYASESQLQKLSSRVAGTINDNSAMSAGLQRRFQSLYSTLQYLQQMQKEGRQVDALTFDRLRNEFQALDSEMKHTGQTGNSLLSSIRKAITSQTATFVASVLSIRDFINYAQRLFSTIQTLDYELVDLRKTAHMTTEEFEDFYYESNQVAKEMGVSTANIISQAAAWSRLGYNTKEAAGEMARLSSQFASISPGMTTEEAQTGLVSIMKAWDVDVAQVERDIMDNINTLGNNFAETNLDIINGMERAGATFAAIGMDIQDSFALFTGAQEVVQNAETVGVALKTLSLRIRGYDEETEELSDDVIEATGKVADLTKVASNNFAGVSLWADAEQTTYRSLVDYLGDIAKIWDEIGAKEKTDLLESLFGKRGASVGSAILGNFDQVEKALTEMENAAGSADREMGIVQESLSYKLNALQQTWVGVAQKIAQRDTLGRTLDNLTKISEALGDIISKKGGLVTIAATLTGFIGGIRGFGLEHIIEIPKQIGLAMRYISAGTQKGGNIFDTLNNFLHYRNTINVEPIKELFRDIRDNKGIDAYNEFLSKLGDNSATEKFVDSLRGDDSIDDFIEKIKQGEINLEDLEAAEQGAAAASNLLSGALTAIGFAVATWVITEAIHYMDNVAEAAQNATDNLIENAEKLDEYISSIKNLRGQLDDSNTTTAQAVEYNKQLREIQKELIELYGDSARKIDIFNGSLEEQGNIIERLQSLSTSEAAYQKWLNEVNADVSLLEKIRNIQVHFGGPSIPQERMSHFELINRKYEVFRKNIQATSDETLNKIIASYDDITLKNGRFIINGNVEDVRDTIVDIQARLKSYEGYTEEFNQALQDVYNSANKIVSKYGDTYNQGLKYAVATDETARDYQDQLNAAFTAFDNATTDEEKKIASDSIANIVQAIKDSDIDKALQNYLVKQTNSYMPVIAQLTLSSWKKAIDFVSERGGAKPLYAMFFGEDIEDVLSTPGFDLVEKLANGAYISADVQNMSEEFQILADTLRLDVEELLELLRLLGLLDNKESVAASLTAPGQRTAQKNYLAKQILETEDGLEIYNQLIADGYGDYLEGEASPEKLAFIKRYVANYRNAIIAELEKTGKTIDAWFEKNGDFVDDYQKNLASINEAISGYYSGTLSPDDMIDLYQEFPEIIESSDDLGTALKKLRVKQIEKLYDDLGEDVPDKLRMELQRLEDQADQTAEALNNFSFENTVQSLKDGVEMIQSLNAGFEDGERGFDTIFSDDFVKTFGKYKKEYSALVKTVETKGFKTNKKLQEQARQQANALGNIWLKDNIGLLSEEELNTAKAMFEELGFQIEGVAMDIQSLEEAQQEATKAGIDWDDMNAESIQHLIDLGTITKATAQEILWFKMQETIANMTSLETDKSIDNLLELLSTINMVAGGITGLSGLMAEINSIQATYTAGRPYIDSKTGQARDIKDVLQDTLDKWRGSLTDWTIPDTPDFGTGKDKDKGGGSDDKEKETEEVVDWIEKLIDRLERKLEHLEKVAGSTYETWETRANSLVEALEVTKQEIDAQRAAYDRYMAEANAVGLDEGYAQKIRDGAIDIETITDEELKSKIDKYDEYYTKALDAEEKIYDLTLHLSELAQQQFELIQTKFEKMITAIETSIQHVQNEIDDIFQKTLSSSYDEMIASHRDEISQLEAEYQELTQSLAESINAGYITEGTEAWYDMKNAIDEVSNSLQEQRNQIHELIKEQFDLIDSLYSGILEGTSLAYDKIDAAVDHLSTLGFVEAAGLYRRQLTEQVANLKQYYDEVAEQQSAFDKAVAEGMEEGSEAWVDMTSAINDTWNNIISTTAAIDDLRVALWELDWSKFEHGQAMIRNVIDEANFLVGLFKEDSLIDDYGFFTDNGVAVEGLHMQNFQTYKSQAQDYLDQIKAIEEMMNGDYVTNPEMLIQLIDGWIRDTYDIDTSDWKYEDYLSYADLFGEDLSYNDKLLQQKQELIDAYQDAVKGAEDEKQAIIDLINQAYDQQLAYINKLIDAKKEQLDVDKDLYEYSKNVQDQTDNIGKLQKQLAAIANDNSEEAMARRQKLQSELNEAQKQLDDTQYDRWYSDQQNMLDKLSKEYGEMIDEVKKNTDANFLQIQEYLDNNLEQVNDALEQVTDKVGYEIQENAFATIWGSNSTVSDVLGGVQSTLSSILEFNEKMYSAATNIGDWFTRWLGMESTVSDETSADTLVNSFYQAFLERNAEEAGYLDWYNQLRNGASVLDIVKGFMYSEEYMGMNKSDPEKIQDLYQSLFGRNGSVEEIEFWLEKLMKDGLSWDDVISGFVNSQEFAQSAIWKRLMDDSLGISGGYEGGWLDWMNDNPVADDSYFKDYINDKFKRGGLVVHPIEDWEGLESVTYAQNIGSISFELPNVTDYASFVKQAQNDPKFEKMIQSMTINQLSGASALSKYKY